MTGPNAKMRVTGAAVMVAVAIFIVIPTGAGPHLRAHRPAPDPLVSGDTVTFAGEVLDSDGRPLGGAVVYAQNGLCGQVWGGSTYPLPWRLFVPDPLINSNPGQPEVRGRTTTDQNGRFSVDGIEAPVEGHVRVVHPSCAAIVVPADPDALRDGVVDFGIIRLERGCILEALVVTPEGLPAEKVWVGARRGVPRHPEDDLPTVPWPKPGDLRVARTDADGRCRIEGLREGGYVVACFSDRNPAAEKVIEIPGEGVVETSLTLKGGRTLRVETLDRSDGSPRVGVRVDVYLGPWRNAKGEEVSLMIRPPPVASMRTGKDGVADFKGLDEGEYDLDIIPEDHAGGRRSNHPPFAIKKRVKAGDTVRVHLHPILDLKIVAVSAETGGPVSRLDLRASPLRRDFDEAGGAPTRVSASFEGARESHVLEGFRPGTWKIHAFAPDHLPSKGRVVEVPPGGLGDPVRLEFKPAAGRIAGSVVASGTGAPVAGAMITSHEATSLGDGQRASAVTNADGRYEIGPLLGKGYPLSLTVEAPGFLPRMLHINEEEDRANPLAAFRLVRAARIQGILRDAASSPVAYSRLALLVKDGSGKLGKGGVGEAGYRFVQRSLTGADGAFAFDDLAPGSYTIRDIPPGSSSVRWDQVHVEEDVEVAEGARLEMDLRLR